MVENSLMGKRILLVEDEALLAALLEDLIGELGGVVASTAPSTRAALKAIDQTRIDSAIMDINLGAGPNFEVAERLEDRDIPFVFSTGYGSDSIAGRFSGRLVLAKPFHIDELDAALRSLLGRSTAA